jgi:nitrite reductase/ring-hydroxylating ferredoxin subunit
MAKLSDTRVFNNTSVFVDGWYWLMPSKELKSGKVVGIEFLGKSLAVYRGESGKVFAIEAYCPHMGAHFKEGKVEGDAIRCAFHGWKFDSNGQCSDIPCKVYADQARMIPPIESYVVEEHYGLVWIYTGQNKGAEIEPLPRFADLDPNEDLEIVVGGRTVRPCRPEIVMLNAIDAHHFNSVHPAASNLAGGMELRPSALSSRAIRLENHSPVPKEGLLGKLLMPFYKSGKLTYFLDYWYASTGVVTLGPDFLKLYLLFPHRPTMDGGTQGIMVYIARKKKGLLNLLFAKIVARVTAIVGAYFERGDREIFESIKFSMRAPVKADHPIIEFMRHTERQNHKALPWKGNSPAGEEQGTGL